MKRILFLLVAFFYSISLYSQTRVVTGKVSDKNTKESLAGASIVVMVQSNSTADSTKSSSFNYTTIGAFSDADGTFSVDIYTDSICYIEVSYIGMETQKIKITQSNFYPVLMSAGAIAIETVVVTVPYGKLKKETFTGSLTSVKSNVLSQSTESSFDKALQGQVAGIVLTSSSGQPGAASQIQMRGAGSISASSQPLVVIDGVVMYGGETSQNSSGTSILASINPNDIESVSVLKDASATSLYGSRASNGVIMITTKQGKQGKTNYSFSSTQGIGNIVLNNFDVLNASQYRTIKTEAMKNAGKTDEAILRELLGDTAQVNWIQEVFKPAYYQTYDFVAQGGDAKTTFFISSQYKNEEGIVRGTNLERYSMRLNISNKASDKLSFGIKFNPSFSTQNITDEPGIVSSAITGAFTSLPTTQIKYANDYNFENSFYNPVGITALNENRIATKRLLGSVFLNYKIYKDLEFNSIENLDYIINKELKFIHPKTPDGISLHGVGEEYITEISTLTSSNTVAWKKSFSNIHNISLLGGVEIESQVKNFSNMIASNFPFENLHSLANAAKMEQINSYYTESALLSFFSNFQYNYKSKYFASASVRADGSSKFKKHWGEFWSLGGSWIISNESFLANNSKINFLKLRTSYGTSGNANINDYAYYQLYEFGKNYNGDPGSSPSQMGNDNLSWEKNNNANVGIDAKFYDKIETSIDLYHRTTYDLLLQRPVTLTSGYAYRLENLGSMVNKGIEITVDVVAIKKQNFDWKSGLTFSRNINTITELYTENIADTILQGTKIRTEGYSLQSFYLRDWAGVNSADGSPMWYDSKGNLTKDYNKARSVYAGTADPLFTASWNNTLAYKNISLNFLFYYNYGNIIFNQLNTELLSDGAIWGKNMSSQAVEHWQNPGDISENPKVVQNNPSNSNKFSTRYLEDGTYLRLKHIQINYTLPSKFIEKYKISSCSIYTQVQNAWLWTAFSGVDPETRSSGVYYYDYPKQRLFTSGISIKF